MTTRTQALKKLLAPIKRDLAVPTGEFNRRVKERVAQTELVLPFLNAAEAKAAAAWLADVRAQK